MKKSLVIILLIVGFGILAMAAYSVMGSNKRIPVASNTGIGDDPAQSVSYAGLFTEEGEDDLADLDADVDEDDDEDAQEVELDADVDDDEGEVYAGEFKPAKPAVTRKVKRTGWNYRKAKNRGVASGSASTANTGFDEPYDAAPSVVEGSDPFADTGSSSSAATDSGGFDFDEGTSDTGFDTDSFDGGGFADSGSSDDGGGFDFDVGDSGSSGSDGGFDDGGSDSGRDDGAIASLFDDDGAEDPFAATGSGGASQKFKVSSSGPTVRMISHIRTGGLTEVRIELANASTLPQYRVFQLRARKGRPARVWIDFENTALGSGPPVSGDGVLIKKISLIKKKGVSAPVARIQIELTGSKPPNLDWREESGALVVVLGGASRLGAGREFPRRD